MEIIKVKATGRDVGALGTVMGVVRGPVRGQAREGRPGEKPQGP